jgi:hypothetical protein
MLFGNRSQRSKFSEAGVGEENVDVALVLFDRGVQPGSVK